MKAEPFLRWVGGKQQLAATLSGYLPDNLAQRRYVEPFLGAGSMFFAIAPKQAYLADANRFLIEAYKSLRTNPAAVHRELGKLVSQHSKENYYKVRDRYNRCQASTYAQAARFIYLNKTCFNGIFRVNTKGEFNVPKGSKDKLTMPTQDDFKAIADALSGIELTTADFQLSLMSVKQGDFVYLDPPYPALNETAYFAHYTVDRFPAKTQEKLAQEVKRIDTLGASFLMSNADLPEIRNLYSRYSMVTVPVTRFVSCKGVRTPVAELIIRNY